MIKKIFDITLKPGKPFKKDLKIFGEKGHIRGIEGLLF